MDLLGDAYNVKDAERPFYKFTLSSLVYAKPSVWAVFNEDAKRTSRWSAWTQRCVGWYGKKGVAALARRLSSLKHDRISDAHLDDSAPERSMTKQELLKLHGQAIDQYADLSDCLDSLVELRGPKPLALQPQPAVIAVTASTATTAATASTATAATASTATTAPSSTSKR